jgi:cytochrome c-type biogenesis protein CcmE
MNRPGRKQRRLLAIGALFFVVGVAMALILSALDDNIVFFLSPSEIAAKHFAPGQRVRLGGMVSPGSLKRKGASAQFTVTDGKQTMPVIYVGPLPDLFREGQGVVAEGQLQDHIFKADMVLAKHDENYMPREVADALKKQGYWRDRTPQPDAQKK